MSVKRFLPAVYMLAVFLIMGLIILYPEKYVHASAQGILIFSKSVLPALLPFMFITAVMTRTGGVGKLSRALAPLTKRIFKMRGISAYVYIMSVLSGYPIGSKIISDLYEGGQITSSEATKMSVFCSTSGPLFIIGSIGAGMFGSKQAGFVLYIAHILSGLVCGIIFRSYPAEKSAKGRLTKPQKADNVLGDAMLSSVTSVLCVGGFITVFYILADILTDYKILYPVKIIFSALLSPFTNNPSAGDYAAQGLIEVTRGCSLMSMLPGGYVLPLVSFIIAFGGVSVILQQVIFLKKAKVKISVFMLAKALHAVTAFIICYLLILI